MIIALLIVIPALSGALCFFLSSVRLRRGLLILASSLHFALTLGTWIATPHAALGGWLQLDDLGKLFLSITSTLFLASSLYALGYLRHEAAGRKRDLEESIFFTNEPEQVFLGCLLLLLSAMSLVTLSHHLGLIWVAIEATTLFSAPLIYFHRHRRSLEATWKYLLICSVGIALALLGNFFLAVSASTSTDSVSLVVEDLVKFASTHGLLTPWLKAAFLCLLVGYGTKMGLAPMHSWLPDAHSESPSLVSALLSGALLNCAFLGILRVLQVCSAAGLESFARDSLLGFGLVSMAFAAIFVTLATDYKRMLAYSSVEHMGILALGVGIGGLGNYGSMLHAVNHSLTKAMLFLVSGNILAAYHTKASSEVRGLLKRLPLSGILWIVGFLAITGSPPFGTFLSEFTIFRAALDHGYWKVGIAYLVFLTIIFVGMLSTVMKMSFGASSEQEIHQENSFAVAPAAVLAILVLVLGIYIPSVFETVLQAAAGSIGGTP